MHSSTGDTIMSSSTRLLRRVFAGAAIAIVSGSTIGSAQSVMPGETIRSVSRMLTRLPYYGVFDFLAFGVDRGTVTLVGWSYEGNLKGAAEMAAKRAAGVSEVANKIELLPASSNDDRIRWATFYRIYTDDFLSRYAPGGGSDEALRELKDAEQFPGMQPVGRYSIHIIVKNGRTTL